MRMYFNKRNQASKCQPQFCSYEFTLVQNVQLLSSLFITIVCDTDINDKRQTMCGRCLVAMSLIYIHNFMYVLNVTDLPLGAMSKNEYLVLWMYCTSRCKIRNNVSYIDRQNCSFLYRARLIRLSSCKYRHYWHYIPPIQFSKCKPQLLFISIHFGAECTVELFVNTFHKRCLWFRHQW